MDNNDVVKMNKEIEEEVDEIIARLHVYWDDSKAKADQDLKVKTEVAEQAQSKVTQGLNWDSIISNVEKKLASSDLAQ